MILFNFFKNHFDLQLLELSFTILSVLHQFKIPSKQFTFNKRIVSVKNFTAISLVVYAVSTTKDFEPFLAILSCITPLNSE